jgi:molybdenum cofactor biosynthesis enzyme
LGRQGHPLDHAERRVDGRERRVADAGDTARRSWRKSIANPSAIVRDAISPAFSFASVAGLMSAKRVAPLVVVGICHVLSIPGDRINPAGDRVGRSGIRP